MRTKNQNRPIKLQRWQHRAVAYLLVVCLLLSYLNLDLMVSYATANQTVNFEIGENVTAVLEDGVLTLSGMGDTEDYTAGTAPFLEYADEIQNLVIEDGITRIGDYLFYGLGQISGELTLPESIVSFGQYAFSGEDLEHAPKFTVIRNLFESGEITRREPQDGGKVTATPSNQPGVSDRRPTKENTGHSEAAAGEAAAQEPDHVLPETSQETESAGAETDNGSESPNLATSSIAAYSSGAGSRALTEKVIIEDQEVPLAGIHDIIPAETMAETTAEAMSETTAETMPETTAETMPETRIGTMTEESEPNTDTFSASGGETSLATPSDGRPGYMVESIIQQEVADPETLFFHGQSGMVVCSDENTPFIEAAIAAGYQVADGLATVTLDDMIEMELPTINGQICLPGCPAEISSPYEEDEFFSYKFIGWTATPSDAAPAKATGSDAVHSNAARSDAGVPVYAEGDFLEVQENEALSLYSSWISESKYQLEVKTELKDKEAVYSLIDGRTDDTVSIPVGYDFRYQWQYALKGEGEAVQWMDIAQAEEAVYVRMIEADDGTKQFRCKVTPVRLTRSRMAGEQIELFSDPANGVDKVITVYVDATKGNDTTGDGTKEKPYQTIEKAAGKLKKKIDGGSVESNRIVIIGEYKLENDLLKDTPVPVTITGETGATIKAYNADDSAANDSKDWPLYLWEDLCLESITTGNLNHIYGNGYNITIGNEVINKIGLYLYGAGRDTLTNTSVGKVTVKSGTIARIAGYVRSYPLLDVGNKEANITIEGGTVSTIIAGNASGRIEKGNVVINITGGTVTNVSGGNQGFNAGDASFSGKTDINISGGTVTNVYGAGTGRNVSIPAYTGNLNIKVTGGTVTNIYGAGSAAYVANAGHPDNAVNISVVNGKVGSIFAAGRGGDDAIKIDDTYKEFPDKTPPKIFGSLNGTANITVGAGAEVGSIYAGGEGYIPTAGDKGNNYKSDENACLNGKVKITLQDGCHITGNVYGGGKGTEGFPARGAIKAGSKVDIFVEGGTVDGSVFGGGALAKAEAGAATNVHIQGGTIKGNVYGGGEKGQIEGKTEVDISGGTINGSVYGGALGESGQRLVLGGSTTNVTGGWIRRNLYGGSEYSNDGPSADDSNKNNDLIVVNLAGGTVSGNVFGGGYQGTVTGSTHLHIGSSALDDCEYYKSNSDQKPSLEPSSLSVGGSVYAGGDYGGTGEIDYNVITVTGTSHVYIDGTGYCTDSTSSANDAVMMLGGGVFGSGASCDAGSTRIVTLENYGVKTTNADNANQIGATRKLNAIQRADRVVLNNSHVELTGQSDQANANQTALYSLNRIGDHGQSSLKPLENALVLRGGSTLVLESAIIETANFSSETAAGKIVELSELQSCPNTIRFKRGTVFRLSYTEANKAEHYGAVQGYAYMVADSTADAYAYARRKDSNLNATDGGFAAPDTDKELNYTNVEDTDYRYWRVNEGQAEAERYTVLTAQTLESKDVGYNDDKYSVAMSTIDLPQTDAETIYEITGVELPKGLYLVDAAKNELKTNEWVTSDSNVETGNSSVDLETEKNKIFNSGLDTFGLFMEIGNGFSNTGTAPGKVLSNKTAIQGDKNSIVGQKTAGTVGNALPQLNFYLTFYNDITVSKSLGTVKLILESKDEKGEVKSKVTVNVEIVTKASALTDQTLELYATQGGSYTGQLIIPVGDDRKLTLSNMTKNANLVSNSSTEYQDGEFSITMNPENSQGWRSIDLSEAYDLENYTSGSVSIGATDGRFQAPINFTLKNAQGFTSKVNDVIILTLNDGSSDAKITIVIKWEDSVVSSLKVGEGRQYNGVTEQERVVISKKSSVTAAFTIGAAEQAQDLWLEFRATVPGGETKNVLPPGVKLTLFWPGNFYCYTITDSESDNNIVLSEFREMTESNARLAGSSNIGKDTVLTVIADFSDVLESNLQAADYSLRLRSNDTADSQGADFTIDNSKTSVALSGGGGNDKGKHTFQLQVTTGSDTRMRDGMRAVLSPGNSDAFPAGTIFTYGGNTYYPSNNRVSLPLEGTDKVITVVMDTTNTQGLTLGDHQIKAELYPAGYSSGETTSSVASALSDYSVTESPSYGIHVKLSGNENRVFDAASAKVLTFDVSYTVSNIKEPVTINISEQVKGADGKYAAISSWQVEENTGINNGSGTAAIKVTVPENTAPGTYRLIFEFGDQRVPYNIIIK